ncbi:MAG: flavodoxin domain-containing protein [Methanomicrobium sp.]|nr:flavodoxin domain-containing protein [Methanomicrobium sp.]
MSTNFKNLLNFISQNENEIFSSPRALFGKGEEELFTILNANNEKEEISLKLEDNQTIIIKYKLINEAVLLLEDKGIVPLSSENSSDNSLSMEEHLKFWQFGTDNTILNNKIVPYITDILVLSGFAAYGWAKSGTGGKFAAIALTEKKQKQFSDDKKIPDKLNTKPAHEDKKERTEKKIVPETQNINIGSVLIAYSTKNGSTADIAWSIKNSFQDEGIPTDVKRIQDVDDVRKYKFVIIGTPIYDNKLLPEAVEFVKLHKSWLSKRMTALFIVGISLKGKNDETILNMSKISDEIEKIIRLEDVGMFAGKLSPENLPLRKRINTIFNKDSTGDFRDWRDIGEWADKMKKIYLQKMG